MPAFPLFAPSTGSFPSNPLFSPYDKRTDSSPADSLFTRTLDAILPRSTDAAIEPRSGFVKANSIHAGILVIFCLLGASLGLLVWWWFIRRGGFIWKKSDWQDYKSSVLRRPEMRPDDAITVFGDGTTRRGGSSTGTRTVVLGELDTTYTKSVVQEKPFGPREMRKKGAKKAKSVITSIWGKGEGSVWGKIRGGHGRKSNADTEVMREKEMQLDEESTVGSFVDNEEPAPPLRDFTRADTVVRHPTPKRRDVSYTVGDDHMSHVPLSSDSEDDSSDDSDDESELDASEVGMGKGTKVYHHPISRDNVFWTAGKPLEKNGGGAAGSYAGSGVGKGYRRGSHGSLSSEGSLQSSNDGR